MVEIPKIVSAVITLSRYSGVCPLVGTFSKLTISRFWVFYNIFLSIIHLVMYYFLWIYSSNSDISNIDKFLTIYSAITPNLIFIFFLTAYCRVFVKFVAKVYAVFLKLTHIDIRLYCKQLKKLTVKYLVVGILLCVIVPSSSIFSGNPTMPFAILVQVVVSTLANKS